MEGVEGEDEDEEEDYPSGHLAEDVSEEEM